MSECKNHRTVSRATTEYAKFQEAVLRALPRDIDPGIAFGWAMNGKTLACVLREVFMANGKLAGKVFPITCEGVKTSELVKHGRYDDADERITDKLFPIERHAPQARMIEIVKLELGHDPTSNEVLAEFVRRGLKQPTYEDALVFGVAYPKEQKKHPIVFLHEPVRVGSDRKVIMMGSCETRLERNLERFNMDTGCSGRDIRLCDFKDKGYYEKKGDAGWYDIFVFAAVRE